ncbi:MAG: nucleoside deaminase [Bacteroidetes bacterium]|nr:nucleoside deaminase [Bacteroidota bacterium]
MEFNIFSDDHYMRKAYNLALQAFDEDEVPVGAVVVSENQIIGAGYNQVERLNDVTAHAEMVAITSACEYLGAKYLTDCTLYVTLEPCAMCAGVIHWAQIGKLVYAASDPKKGFSNYSPGILLPKVQIDSGIMQNDCATLVKEFFAKKRN